MRTTIDVAVIGAGPYGLTLANALRKRGVEFEIFGKPLQCWKDHMPPGMLLKSFPWASSLYAAQRGFTIRDFCSSGTLPYHDTMMALTRETFVAYAEEFRSRLVPNIEPKTLLLLTRSPNGFRAELDDGRIVDARRVVIAVGMQPFRHAPGVLDRLPKELCSHSGEYGSLDRLAGRNITIVGAGASATDLAALLHEKGSLVCLAARADAVAFAAAPRRRGLLERLIKPASGIGEGLTLTMCAGAPGLLRLLPEVQRIKLAYPPTLGPMGGAFMRDRLIGKIQIKVGVQIAEATARGGSVHLYLRSRDGTLDVVRTDHVIAATGYKVDVQRLTFLDRRILDQIKCLRGAPILSAHYESSVPGLHFVGPIAAHSFGPVARFLFGTRHLCRSLSPWLPTALSRRLPRTSGRFTALEHAVPQ